MTDPTAPTPPPNWYPDPNEAARLRYWDGAAWTDHVAPAVAPTPSATAASPSPASPASTTKRNLVIAGAVVLGVIMVGGAAAASGGRDDDPAPVATVAPITSSPTPTAPAATPSPTVPPAPVVDPAAFRSSANSHLDDMQKDLDDMVVTLDEGGFWRLLSNSLELSFNLGQLRSLEAPPSVATVYADSLARLEGSIDALTDPIAAADDPGTRAAIEAVRTEVESTRAVVEGGQ